MDQTSMETPQIAKSKKTPTEPLKTCFETQNKFEIGIDEAGRGPMFGPVYVAGVVLPKDGFDHHLMKDSKKFHSEKKIRDVASYIQSHAIAWHVACIEPNVIDAINIRQAVMRGMHECCAEILKQLHTLYPDNLDEYRDVMLCVDGNDFIPYQRFDTEKDTIVQLRFETVEGGDNTYTHIAAASILAKVSRDTHILEMCQRHPILDTYYNISSNKGYGAKLHMEGIKQYGITPWHRKSFGCCKTAHELPSELFA